MKTRRACARIVGDATVSRLYVEILVNDCQQEKEDTEEAHTIFGFPVIISARRSHS